MYNGSFLICKNKYREYEVGNYFDLESYFGTNNIYNP